MVRKGFLTVSIFVLLCYHYGYSQKLSGKFFDREDYISFNKKEVSFLISSNGVQYYINNTSDIVSINNAIYQATTSNGPSNADMNDIAGYFGSDQFLIDRTNIYSYNTSKVVNNDIFLFRYFPISWLRLNK